LSDNRARHSSNETSPYSPIERDRTHAFGIRLLQINFGITQQDIIHADPEFIISAALVAQGFKMASPQAIKG
jgi:hypothetical protein